jgi:hypothetical protein
MDLIDEIVLPKDWQELVALKDTIPFCRNKVTRFPEDNQAYVDYRENMSREEHLQHILDEIGDQDIKVDTNKFPYSRLIQYIPNVNHYCLWSKNQEITDDQIESTIKNLFTEKEYFWFVNPIFNKSIPEIWHCHIFVKEK